MFSLYLALFFSGTSSLIAEIVWLRLLVLVFGNTAHSTILILSVFMAGLAFGSLLFGRLADTHRHLLRLYSFIEISIGIYVFLTLQLIKFSSPWFQVNNIPFLKLILSFIILFPATTLMGATLPVLVKFLHQYQGKLALQVSRLYAANTAGAVFGTLLSGFILIELFGLKNTLIIGILGNFIAAFLAFFVSLQLKKFLALPKESIFYSPRQVYLLLLVFGLSGLISIAYEVIFIRLITPSTGTFIYGFSASLAVYLLGLTSGSFIYHHFMNFKGTLKFIGYVQLLISLAVFVNLVFIAHFIPLWLPHPLVRLIAPIVIFYPLTVLLGLIFPILSQAFSSSNSVATHIGLAYSINSFGSILGSLMAGLVLIPLVGSVGAAFTLSIINALLGLLLILNETTLFRPALIKIFSLTLPILILSLIGLYQSNKFFLPRYIKVQLKHHLNRWSDTQFVLKEDVVASVFVTTSQARQGRKLLIDGVGTTSLSEETKLLAHLPLLLHPDYPENVLIIALGMGTTFRSALSHPQTKVDVVELVPSIPPLMPYFHTDADKIINHPRGNIIINDGRNYVFTTPQKYDVVAIDPPPPDNAAGTTILFSQNFYQDIKRILNPNGIILGWFNYDVDVTSYRMMLQAFIKEFPYILVFRSPRNLGLYLIGSPSSLALDQQKINTITSQSSVAQDMSEWSGQIYDYAYLQSLYLGTEMELRRFVGELPAVTDYYPRSEYFLLRQLTNPTPPITQDIINQYFTISR